MDLDEDYQYEASDSDSDSEYPGTRIDYLFGPGVLEVTNEEMQDPRFSFWVLGESNISAIFMEHRRGIVQKAEQLQQLTKTEQLALNFIFIINSDNPVPSFLSSIEWDNITRFMINKWPIFELSESSRSLLQRFERAANTSMNAALDASEGMVLNEQLATNWAIRHLTRLLAQMYGGLLEHDMNKDRFVYLRVEPVLAAFFRYERDITIDWTPTTLASSETAIQKFDPSLPEMVSDITVSLLEQDDIVNLVIVKVKPPAKAKRDVDLVELANMMKDSLDCIHDKGLTSTGLCVMGIIVEGYRCDIYVMDLDHTFFYRMYKMGTFYIPVDRYDFARLPNLVEKMLTLRKCMYDMVEQYEGERVAQFRTFETPPLSMKRTKPSFIFPARIP